MWRSTLGPITSGENRPFRWAKTEPNVGVVLTVKQGAALSVGAVLGTGVIALPGLAAQVAGPAALIAWVALIALSAPLAMTFAALGARFPDTGGVASYVGRALATATLAAAAVTGLSARPIMLAVSGSFIVVYVLGTAAAARLLPPRSWARRTAAFALVSVLGLLLLTGWYVLWSGLVAAAALLFERRYRSRSSTMCMAAS